MKVTFVYFLVWLRLVSNDEFYSVATGVSSAIKDKMSCTAMETLRCSPALTVINKTRLVVHLGCSCKPNDCPFGADCRNKTTNYTCTCGTIYKNWTARKCPNDTTGETVTQGKFFWLAQGHNMCRSVKCLYGSVSQLEPTRRCRCNDTTCNWLPPENIMHCKYKSFTRPTTKKLTNLLQLSKKNHTPGYVSKVLVNLTTNVADFTGDDFDLTVLILEKLLQQINETGPDIVKSVNNVLNIKNIIVAKKQNECKRALEVLNEYLETVPIAHGGNITQNEANIAVFSQVVNVKDYQGATAASFKTQQDLQFSDFIVYNSNVSPNGSQVTLSLPKSLFKSFGNDSKKKEQRISFVIYRKTTLFQARAEIDDGTIRKKSSFVISGSVKGHTFKNLTHPVVSTYVPLDKDVNENTACVFWDFQLDNGLGDWSEVGCSYQKNTGALITCHCNHLTNFAILLDFHIDNYNSGPHEQVLSTISYIACSLSLLGLLFTIVTILMFQDMRSKLPSQILLNFCIALFSTLVVFLAAAERSKTSSMVACRVAAIALHYFVLATFMWMAVEAFNMYQAFAIVIPKYYSRFMLKSCIICWGIPAIIVTITAAIAFEEYGGTKFCRVEGLPFYVAFLFPVVLILVINSVAFAIIFYSLLTSHRNIAADRRPNGFTQARRGAAILVVLGLTWLFGAFAVKDDTKLVFNYLFCTFNSLQGFLVFVFYCLISTETRRRYATLLSRGNKTSALRKKSEIRIQNAKHISSNSIDNLCRSSLPNMNIEIMESNLT